MENSNIEWTHHTANLWHGCMEVHEGCDNCYARVQNNRYHKENPHWGGKAPRLHIKKTFNDLLTFHRKAASVDEVHSVFVGSMMDIFEKPMPLVDGKGNPAIDASDGSPVLNFYLREDLFNNISSGMYPNLLFLLLTKRPSNINKYIPEAWKINGAPENVMFGISIVNQETANKMLPEFSMVKGRKFLSMEPLLGPVEFSDVTHRSDYVSVLGKPAMSGIDWVIAGGESGHGARPMDPDWARSLRDQCSAAGVPYFFKQWGEWMPLNAPTGMGETYFSDGSKRFAWYEQNHNSHRFLRAGNRTYYHLGKKEAGALLDGVEHKNFPV